MAFFGVFCTVLVAFYLAMGVQSASVSLSSNRLTLSGNAHIQFYGPIEDVWAGLSNGHRYPTINSGDIVAFRLAYTSGSTMTRWLSCTTSYCSYNTCGGTSMSSSKWSSCTSQMQFKITAFGKMDGQPINSGDTVTLGSKYHGYNYRLRCSTSSSYKCNVGVSISSLTGNSWLTYSYATFQLFSKDAVDGTPVQFGDVVGLKYPYGASSYWLYYNTYFYANSCSSNRKTSCARVNYPAGLQIFKQL